MSKKPLEIYTVIGVPPDSVRITKVWMQKQDDLYVTTHAPDLMAGKYTYHASGVTHRYSELIKRRSGEGQPPHRKLRGMQGFVMVTAFGCPAVLEPTGYQPKPDTKARRTLIAQLPQFGRRIVVLKALRHHLTA